MADPIKTDPTQPKPGMTTGKTPNQTSATPPGTAPSTEARDAARMAEETGAAASSRASELADTAKAEAGKLAASARARAETEVEGLKGQATSRIEETAEHIRNAGHEFGDESYQAQAADYLASNLSSAADFIRDQDLGSLTADVSSFARRNPAVFLSGAAVLGFALARMMKATERDHAPEYATARRTAPAPMPGQMPGQPRPIVSGYRR